jgi:exodeoxyribonuclease VII large subunit
MSGPGAPGEVARAVELLADACVELILIARGGGAKSELAAWESRPVALAITACPVPIWTALGHATDHTLADSLAQVCHPAPSAAAASLVGRAEAAVRAEEQEAERRRHQAQLVASRRRAAAAVAIAVVLVLAVMAVLLARAL